MLTKNRAGLATYLMIATVLGVLVRDASAAASACGDVDCSGDTVATDALLVLQSAVGLDVGLDCECVTTTTTTTLPVSCNVDVAAFTAKLGAARCVAYAPSGAWNPATGDYPSMESVEQDLELLIESGFDCIVTYGATDVLGDVPCVARKIGFTTVVMGVFDPASAAERAAAALAAPCTDAYSVGNEGLTIPYCCGSDYGWDTLFAALASLREETCRPVTTSEPYGAYVSGTGGHDGAEMRALGDWIFPNVHPYFAGHEQAAVAAAWTAERYAELGAAAGATRFVLVKETGLPSAGDDALGEENQRAYFEALLATSTRFAAFEAFDQLWKTSLPVEPHWGIFESDRNAKAAASVFSGP